jgi:fatty acid synthase
MVDLSENRWNGVYGLSKYTGFISGMENFDADFFGFSDSHANSMDPQSRMILEHAYEAILDAGM